MSVLRCRSSLPRGPMLKQTTVRLAVVAALCGSAACSSRSGAVATRSLPERPAAAVAQEPVSQPVVLDPTTELLKAADERFEAGRHELTLGHLAKAKAEFNRALEVILESPSGARNDVRVREHFDRLV